MFEMVLINPKNGGHNLSVEVESEPEDRPYPTYDTVWLSDVYLHFWVAANLAYLERRGLIRSDQAVMPCGGVTTQYQIA